MNGASGGTSDVGWLLQLIVDHHDRTTKFSGEPLKYEEIPDFFEDLREAFEAFTDGNWLALLDALRICREERLPPPEWLERGLRKSIVDTIRGRSIGKKGRGNTPLAAELARLVKAKRWEVFNRVRLAQKHSPDSAMFAILLPHETSILFNAGKIKSIGTTREDALDVTQKSLAGTFARVSSATLGREVAGYLDAAPTYNLSEELRNDLGLPSSGPLFPELVGGFTWGNSGDAAEKKGPELERDGDED